MAKKNDQEKTKLQLIEEAGFSSQADLYVQDIGNPLEVLKVGLFALRTKVELTIARTSDDSDKHELLVLLNEIDNKQKELGIYCDACCKPKLEPMVKKLKYYESSSEDDEDSGEDSSSSSEDDDEDIIEGGGEEEKN